MTRIAVVQFPGSNCEAETVAALVACGARAEIVRWNAADAAWTAFDGFVLPGGFSYEDRVRAGAVAAKHRALDHIEAAAAAGRPVLGLCNGAQILVEAGLVPGLEPGHVEVALAANATAGWNGYYCDWVHVAATAGAGWAARLQPGPVPMPVGHGEGRFTSSAETFDALVRRGQVAFRYVRADGEPAAGFPDNPNGARADAAGLCDPTGRIVALMPHPERAAWLYQVPEELPGKWGATRRNAAGDGVALGGAGPGRALYAAFVAAASEARA